MLYHVWYSFNSSKHWYKSGYYNSIDSAERRANELLSGYGIRRTKIIPSRFEECPTPVDQD